MARRHRGAADLYGALIPAWQGHRSTEPLAKDSPAARAMLLAAAPWPRLASALGDLDRAYPETVTARVARINQAARTEGVPYWLDVQTVRARPIVLSYRIDSRHHFQAARTRLEVLRLARVDRLRVEMGLLGQASPNGPLVFLNRIEDEWSRLLSPIGGAASPLDLAIRKTLRELAEHAVGESIVPLVERLAQREAAYVVMEKRMRVTIPKPPGLYWPRDWFVEKAALTRFENGRGPMIFNSDLQAVQDANARLDEPRFHEAMRELVALRAEGVEAHEARHAVEIPEPPLPPFLRGGDNAFFLDQINRELRAYLGELHDTPRSPCLGLSALLAASYGSKSRSTPHAYVGRILVHTLGKDPKALLPYLIDPGDPDASPPPGLGNTTDEAAFLRDNCAKPRALLRAEVEILWRALYNAPMPVVSRID